MNEKNNSTSYRHGEMATTMTRAERQSTRPGSYVLDRVPYRLDAHVDPERGLLADAFGGPGARNIPTEDALMQRLTPISKCGQVPQRVQEADLRAAMRTASEQQTPVRVVATGTPITEYMHRARKACTRTPTITNERIADPSILLRDPQIATGMCEFYARPVDVSMNMRDAFVQCSRTNASGLQTRSQDQLY